MSLPRLEEPALLADRVFQAIRAGIMSGDIPSGSRLRIRDLAAQLGTSVMPVREAIRRLEESGLAEREPHKGAVVKALTLSELVHVYDVRLLVEAEAARLGAGRITSTQVDAMSVCYDQMREAIDSGDVSAYTDHDETFLSILYEASGNPVLLSTIRTLWERCRSYKLLGGTAMLTRGNPDALWVHQEQLLAALREGDPERARSISQESLLSATERIRQQLADEGAGSVGGSLTEPVAGGPGSDPAADPVAN